MDNSPFPCNHFRLSNARRPVRFEMQENEPKAGQLAVLAQLGAEEVWTQVNRTAEQRHEREGQIHSGAAFLRIRRDQQMSLPDQEAILMSGKAIWDWNGTKTFASP
jgi:hypothetical protein